MKTAFAPLWIGLLLGLAGCLPVSQNPLSPPEKAVADSRLAGVWYGKSGEDTVFLHFVAGKGAAMDAVEVDHEKSGDAQANLYTLFPSVIDGVRYLNIREKKGAEKKPYYLARYQLSANGTLTIWMMSEKAVARAVKNEKLAGKITPKNSGDRSVDQDITITASTERLAAFLRKSDPEILFSEKFGSFKKLTLPSVEPVQAPEPSAKKSKSHKTAKPGKKTSDE